MITAKEAYQNYKQNIYDRIERLSKDGDQYVSVNLVPESFKKELIEQGYKVEPSSRGEYTKIYWAEAAAKTTRIAGNDDALIDKINEQLSKNTINTRN